MNVELKQKMKGREPKITSNIPQNTEKKRKRVEDEFFSEDEDTIISDNEDSLDDESDFSSSSVEDERSEKENDEQKGNATQKKNQALAKNSRLTTRQKAMLKKEENSKLNEELLSLPMGSKKKKQLTEEEQAKKTELAEKRRIQNRQIIEDQKKMVVDKLLNRQFNFNVKHKKAFESNDTSISSNVQVHKNEANVADSIHFVDNEKGKFLSFPENHFPFTLFSNSTNIPSSNHVVKCAAPGCSNLKCYTSSKLNLPLCNQLACYQKLHSNLN